MFEVAIHLDRLFEKKNLMVIPIKVNLHVSRKASSNRTTCKIIYLWRDKASKFDGMSYFPCADVLDSE